ncbi:DoxX family protein [Listeria rocourtiae]|uniref:DoxX family protein n=1 Tax=Listeria rocourtiae TaxID=647910 RepID=UPI0003E8B5B0|nr:DoxX family protein [Listeria rocourtiae]EUJ47159.1 hypothetical protein PROCOU_10006 [Listeria rocourtiae FSL F6-920]
MAYIVAPLEIIGGLALIFGVLVPYASALIIGILSVAIVTVTFSKGFIGGYEFDFTLLVLAIVTLITGSFKKSISVPTNKRKIM